MLDELRNENGSWALCISLNIPLLVVTNRMCPLCSRSDLPVQRFGDKLVPSLSIKRCNKHIRAPKQKKIDFGSVHRAFLID